MKRKEGKTQTPPRCPTSNPPPPPQTTTKTPFLSKVSIQPQWWQNQKKSCNGLTMKSCVGVLCELWCSYFRPGFLWGLFFSSIYFPGFKKGKYAPGDLTRCKMFLNLFPASLIKSILLFLWALTVKENHRKQETGNSSSFLQIFRK